MKFYDPKDEADLARVETLLTKRGIEYSLRTQQTSGLAPRQVHVAEEDVPTAEELIGKFRER